MDYSHSQWIMFFFCYSVLGWIWEVCYEGVKQHFFINRGFLHGPYLPIYGIGAIIILQITLPHYEHKFIVFVLGMLSASILEFLTGFLLDRFFHLRLWDYRNCFANVGGYICAECSIVWGLFALFLVYFLHPEIEKAISALSPKLLDWSAMVLTVIFTYDFADSFKNASGVKTLLKDIHANNSVMDKLSDDINNFIGKLAFASDELKQNLGNVVLEKEKPCFDVRETLSKKARMMTAIAKHRGNLLNLVNYLNQKADVCLEHLEKLKGKKIITANQFTVMKDEINSFKRHLKIAEWNMAALTEKDYKTAVKLIARNPGSFSKQFPQEFDALRSLGSHK